VLLHSRLQARRAEIEQAALTRVHAISDTKTADPEYIQGLRAAVSAALDYSFAGVEHGRADSLRLPDSLLVQARIAARNKVSLDIVLRRYCSGYCLVGDFLVQEADETPLKGTVLKELLRVQAALFDRLVVAVTDEYARECKERLDTAEERRARHVEGLLAGEILNASELAYDLEANHLGLIARGPGSLEAIRDLAKAVDRRLLPINRPGSTIWAWLGGRRDIDLDNLDRTLSQGWPREVFLAIGEPSHGLQGWRLTHRQARAILPIAMHSSKNFARYSDDALLASMVQDDLLMTSLHQLYLAPIEDGHDNGELFRRTLRAYFAASGNVSSAAAALKISRKTVTNRIATTERRLGRRLSSCSVDLQAALRLEEWHCRENRSFGSRFG